MQTKALFVLAALLLAVALGSNAQRTPNFVVDQLRGTLNRAGGGSSFDYFVFAMTWPGNACRELSPCYIPSSTSDFTIHGLWPSRYTGPQGPFFCGGSFDFSQIQDLVPDLNNYWTDFKNEVPSFWQHEYEKHGTCAASLPRMDNEYKFFKSVLDLRKSMSVLPNLASGGVTPSDSKVYHIQQLKSAMKSAGYGTPALACYHGEQYITEMRFCTDKNLNFIDCPIRDQCHDTVLLNPINPNNLKRK
ncbi:hypothetical protein FDP41_010330 [Naegleria fowleri]|uniref:Uncharacterized protein n=1 Tax=Naegleria fowleri TaxID=5763 RepID=A0A6A5CD36_NAEFO|nr:uncharacterized protein FDP41_010330 [Naegleria fowleri]KAF0983265.1 hypothetical protein FDP41_010330 [Naegleria fowleri]CAG4716557.1 unnamed protein product [Naegleria fowleri]